MRGAPVGSDRILLDELTRATDMQQKYCDQGRSCVVFRMTRPIFFARSSCGCGGNARNASALPSMKVCIASAALGVVIQLNVAWIHADVGDDARNE